MRRNSGGWEMMAIMKRRRNRRPMNSLDVMSELIGIGERDRASRRANIALDDVVFMSGVNEEEVLLEKRQVIEELHLFAKDTPVDLDTVRRLYMGHVRGVVEPR